jgi:hypothetical protein
MTTTKTRRLSVILRLAAAGHDITRAERTHLLGKSLLDITGQITKEGAELIEDLGPLPVRDVELTWKWSGGSYVTEHGTYQAEVTDRDVTVFGQPNALGEKALLYGRPVDTVAAGRVLAADFIRATENRLADHLGL